MPGGNVTATIDKVCRMYKCKQCGKEFTRKKKFCSTPCSRTWWKEHPEQRKQYGHTCKACGEPFTHKSKTRLYCSTKCSGPAGGKKRHDKILAETLKTVWSCGGGVDSTAIAVLICQGKLPKPDYAIMTDHGYDPDYVWEYVYNILMPNLQKVGVKLNIIESKQYTNTTLINSSGLLKIPAFYQDKEGKSAKGRTFCSTDWKLRPALKWLREQRLKRISNWIGIAADESQRARWSTLRWIIYEYPLIDLNLTRQDCIDLIKDAGWSLPERSSCVFCPQKTLKEWQRIKEQFPDDWNRTIEADEFIRNAKPGMFLNPKLLPIDNYVELSNIESRLQRKTKFYECNPISGHVCGEN